jgi:hypothetical protein
MAGTSNVNKAVMIEISSDEDLKNWVKTVADALRQLADDFEIVEMQLNGKLRKMPTVDGKPANAKARNVVMHVKVARSMVWAARKSVLGVYKAFLKQFSAEIEATKSKKKATAEALKITP